MKYLMSWTARAGGEEDIARRREVFKAWVPPPDLKIHQFLNRLDGEGGYAVIETDNPASALDAPSKFCAWFVFGMAPVMEMADSVAVFDQAEEFRASVPRPGPQ